MKAMIFAAGKGTRLKPLTDNTPKALININGIPILEHVITKLIASGVNEMIINVHYLANQIIDFLETKNNFGIRIEISDETNELLDTGGGIKKASWFFNDNQPFIVHNTDIISNINIERMLQVHSQSKALATLAVRNRSTSRYFLFDDKMELCGWKNNKTNEQILSKPANNYSELAFSGIHIINPEIFSYLQQGNKFSIVNSYLDLSKNNIISAYSHNDDYWFDIGTIENLKSTEKFLKKDTF